MPAQTHALPKPYKTPVRIWVVLSLTLLTLGCLSWWLTNLYRERLLKDTYRDAALELTANATSLSSAIESRLLLSKGLKAFVTSEISQDGQVDHARFEIFAASFMQQVDGIRNLSIYPQGIAEYISPLDHNDNVLGINLFTHSDPEVRHNAERTKLTDDITILGPFELTQGGLGLLSRQAIFEEGNRFWGFVSVVLDVPPILQEAGLYNAKKGIDFALRANHQVIMGDPQLFDNPKLIEEVPLSEGFWELSAMPNRIKLQSIASYIRFIYTISIAFLLLVVYLCYILLTQRAKLRAQVAERTVSLEATNQRLEATYSELTSAQEELQSQFHTLENKEQTVRHLAYHDPITGMHNRTFFNEYLDTLITQNEQSAKKMALLFLDLDQFKLTNDTIGHYYGDVLLTEVGRRLSATLMNGEIISRIGGDEFTIILPEITADDDHVHSVAQQIYELFQRPFLLKGTDHFVTTSIGIAIFPEHGHDSITLMKNADLAMYRAKEDGKNQYRFYDRSLSPDAEGIMEIKNSLRRALERDEFTIHYQPQVETKSGTIVGLEALLRWNHPKRGMIPPISFIPIAEDTGLIVPIGEYVLRKVCSQSMAWQRAGIPPIRIAVNLSSKQFMHRNLTERIKEILDETGLDPKYLELEITENIAMKDDMLVTLHELKGMGITISIDDFGTQYSSLSYLKRLPINKIKIDRSFVNGISVDRKDETIISAILLIARRLHLTVIAEGVETAEQLEFLRKNKCPDIQGYYFYKPQPADSIEELLWKKQDEAGE